MDEELKQLDLATAGARRLATAALDALRTPQEALRKAAADYVGSVAARRLAASRRSSVEVIARLSDDDLAELRLWTDERMAEAGETVRADIESCEFWIPAAAGRRAQHRSRPLATAPPNAVVRLDSETLVSASG